MSKCVKYKRASIVWTSFASQVGEAIIYENIRLHHIFFAFPVGRAKGSK